LKTRDGELVGVLILRPKISHKAFSAKEKQLVMRIVQQIPMFLKNALQYRALNESYQQLTETHEHLLKTERINALRLMTRGVCHSFNNSFTGILGRAQLALDDVTEEKVKRHLEIIEHSTLDATQILRHLQDFSREQANSAYHPVDINQSIKDALAAIQPQLDKRREAANTAVDINLDLGKVSCVRGVEQELKDSLVNILVNALESIPEKGQITIKTEQYYSSILISISDTGTGMADEVQNRLFEPFFTTKGRHGRGLGLSIVYGIIQRHGGDISVSSKSNEGSTFRITLPGSSINPEITATSDLSVDAPSRRETHE
jgi:signal transduction histidine kinase